MPRYRTPPLSLEDIWRDGPPIRTRDLCSVTGWTAPTIRASVDNGDLVPVRRTRGRKACYFFTREQARQWLESLGLTPPAVNAVAR